MCICNIINLLNCLQMLSNCEYPGLNAYSTIQTDKVNVSGGESKIMCLGHKIVLQVGSAHMSKAHVNGEGTKKNPQVLTFTSSLFSKKKSSRFNRNILNL